MAGPPDAVQPAAPAPLTGVGDVEPEDEGGHDYDDEDEGDEWVGDGDLAFEEFKARISVKLSDKEKRDRLTVVGKFELGETGDIDVN